MIAEIKNLVSQEFNIAVENIKDDSNIINDLGLDSLDFFKLISALEDNFNVVIPESEMLTVRTITDLYKLLDRKLEK